MGGRASRPRRAARTDARLVGTLEVSGRAAVDGDPSGRALQQILSFHKWLPENVLVIYDDVALPLGTLRFREKGSAGGHNGIKSILAHLHTDAFPRLKIGIGGSQPGEMVGHVLGKFSPDERPLLENTLATALQAVQLARSQGIATAANRFHTRSNPTISKDEP